MILTEDGEDGVAETPSDGFLNFTTQMNLLVSVPGTKYDHCSPEAF
jgi:hypothetical protein